MHVSNRSLADFVTNRFGPELYPGTEDNPTRQLARFSATVEGVRAAWLDSRDAVPMAQLAIMLGVEQTGVLVVLTQIVVAVVKLVVKTRDVDDEDVHNTVNHPEQYSTKAAHKIWIVSRLGGLADYLELGGYGAHYTPRERYAMLGSARACDPKEEKAMLSDIALTSMNGALDHCIRAWLCADRAVVAELAMRTLDELVCGLAEELGVEVGAADLEVARKLRELIDVEQLERAAIAAGFERGDAVYRRARARARGVRTWLVPGFASSGAAS